MQKQLKAWAVIGKRGNLSEHQISQTMAIYADKETAMADLDTVSQADRTIYSLVPCTISYELGQTENVILSETKDKKEKK